MVQCDVRLTVGELLAHTDLRSDVSSVESSSAQEYYLVVSSCAELTCILSVEESIGQEWYQVRYS